VRQVETPVQIRPVALAFFLEVFDLPSGGEAGVASRRLLQCLSMEKSSASILIVQQADDYCYV
jgi:hypothetical protein